MNWQPSLGAWPAANGMNFRVWAPRAHTVEVVRHHLGAGATVLTLRKQPDGTFTGMTPGLGTGDLYRYRIDGKALLPDPASRFQPDGVHGPSQVVDPRLFAWSDTGWIGISLDECVIYELHVGTFSPEGTFAGATERLPMLAELGVTALELMPLAEFPGGRNWGYDGVDLFAPSRAYGIPDDLRRLVDRAHRLDLAVILDVVYNHLGPDGNYLSQFSPYYFTTRHQTPWGPAFNLDGPDSTMVREFFIENALHWIHEYHIDGLRFDATHALVDNGPLHLLAELAQRVRASAPGRRILLIAEDHRNLARLVESPATEGWGLDAVWADDFHHQTRRLLAGDCEAYFGDFSGSAIDLAETIRQGWFYRGQHSAHANQPRGTDPSGLPLPQLVICLQNHDQIGNRAFGERLHHQIDLASFRAATTLLLCCPETPLLFMGQEWAASTPFLFFTDHHQRLGKQVTEGRRHEFRNFSAFSNPKVRAKIPDPQAESTFLNSVLDWAECKREPHASTWRLYQALLRLRRQEPALRCRDRQHVKATALGESAVALERTTTSGPALLIVVWLKGRGTADVRATESSESRPYQVILTTEDRSFTPDPEPLGVELSGSGPVIRFDRPGAIILREASP